MRLLLNPISLSSSFPQAQYNTRGNRTSAMSVLEEASRVNDYFFVVGIDADSLVPLSADAQADEDRVDGHPLKLRYQCVLHACFRSTIANTKLISRTYTHTMSRPLLIDRFPCEDNQETRVENGVADFCFPTGLRLAKGMQMPRFFSFVLTNGEGARSYGHTLVIYEVLPEEVEARLTRQIQEWDLRQEEEQRRREGKTPPLKREDGRRGAFFAEEEKEETIGQVGQADEEEAASHSSLRLSSSTHPSSLSPPSPSSPSDLERIFAPKCLCLLSKYPFVDASRAYLLQLYRLSCSPTHVPLERYICNFLLEVPCPVPGRVAIQYSMLDQIIHYPCPPPYQPLAWWGGLPLEAVFEWLSPENLLTAFNAVLLEQQVLLHSTQFSLLTAVAELLTACMWPLAYSHVFIPILPRQCLYLCANSPVPFLLGCHTESFDLVAHQLPDTVTVMDLDRNQVRLAPGVPLPPLPERRKTKLLRAIKDHANLFERAEQRHQMQQQHHQQQQGLDASAATLPPLPPHPPVSTNSLAASTAAMAAATLLPTSPPSFSHPSQGLPPSVNPGSANVPTTLAVASSPPSTPPAPLPRALPALDDPFSQAGRSLHQGEPGEAGTMNEEAWDAVRDAFLGFFLALLKDYRKYLTFPTNGNPTLKLGFKQTEFIASHPSDWALFLEEFCRTQALQSFLDARLQPDPEDSGEVAYFDDLVEARQKSKPRFYMGTIGGRMRHPSFQRPDHLRQQQEVITRVALQPDVSNLPSEIFVYSGFPVLQEKWFVPPRPVNDLAAGTVEDDGVTLGRRRGRRRRGIKKRNHILRFKSDQIPGDPATLVFSTFLMSFSLSIGRDSQQQPDLGTAVSKTRRNPVGAMPEMLHTPASLPPLSRLDDLTSGVSELSTGRVGGVDGEEDMKERAEAEEDEDTMQEQGNQGSVEGSAATRSTLRQSSSVSSFGLRPHMRRLSEDMKEERILAATSKLTLAFEVLQRMHAQSIAADEWIYRCLIDASSRLGSVDMALQALTEMNEAGFAVDASVLSTLLSGAASSQASQAFSLLDWNKIRRGGSGPGGAGGGGPHSVQRSQKLGVKMSGGTPKVFKDAFSAFRKMGTPGSSSFWSLSAGGNHHPTVCKGVSRGSDISSPNMSRHGSLDRRNTSGMSGLTNSGVLPFDLVLDESARRDTEAMGCAQSLTRRADSREGSEFAETAALRDSSSSNVSDMAAFNTPLINYQVLYGESLLEMLFPNLVLDVNAETCPECNSRLSAAQIQCGWFPDPNNYTTSCPLCLVARETKLKKQQQLLQQQQQQQGMNHLLNFNVDRDRRSSVLSHTPAPPPLRRFVAHFSVHCTAPGWVGSTGQGTPLWCEYLSPWVLRKEVQTILLNDGIESLTSPQFRRAHTASSTIWWNLVLWCREFALPIAFLLQESVEGAASAPLS